MQSNVVFVGDEVTAAGFRLAGATILSDAAAGLPERLADLAAGGTCDLLLMTADCAAALPPALRDRLAVQTRPLVAILPDLANRTVPPDLDRAVRVALGIEA